MKIKVIGPEIELKKLFEDIESGEFTDFKIEATPVKHTDLFDRDLQRLNMWQYGIVIFLGHLAAALAHDKIKSLIDEKYPNNKITIEIILPDKEN